MPPAAPAQQPAGKLEGSSGKKYVFRYVTHDGSTPFFRPVINGMTMACQEIGADCQFMGPAQWLNVPEEVTMIESLIEAKVDALFLDVPDPAAWEKVTKEALAQGIDVMFFGYWNENPPDWASDIAVVAQDRVEAGAAMGRELMKYAPDGGKVAFFTCCPGVLPLNDRYQGAADVLKASGKWEVIGPLDASQDPEKVYGAIEAAYQANPDLTAILDIGGTLDVMGRFIETNDLQDKLIAGGFDLVPATVEGIKKGTIKFSVGQNPFLWGYLPVHQIWLWKEFGIKPHSMRSGYDIIDKTNVTGLDPAYH